MTLNRRVHLKCKGLKVVPIIVSSLLSLIVPLLILSPILNDEHLVHETEVLSTFQVDIEPTAPTPNHITNSSTFHDESNNKEPKDTAVVVQSPQSQEQVMRNQDHDHDPDTPPIIHNNNNNNMNVTREENSTITTATNVVLVVSNATVLNNTSTLMNNTIDEEHTQNRYNETEYQRQLEESLRPIRNQNVTTYVNGFPLSSGFCNQYMYFAGIFFFSISKQIHMDQMLVESFKWKDTLATNSKIPHILLWDVVHWNTHYPILPRFVKHSPEEFPDVKLTSWIEWNNIAPENATRPYSLNGNHMQPLKKYKEYARHLDANDMEHYQIHFEMMKTISKGALRPHPAIQEIVDHLEDRLNHDFMAIHTRIEPDMLVHPLCRAIKVNNVTTILDMIYKKYPEPPVKKVFLIFNRPLTEERVLPTYKELPSDLKNLSLYNLEIIDGIVKNGMWNGTVDVVEAGANLVKDVFEQNPVYMKYNSIVGAVVSFFTSLNSKIFIGTEISTYSTLAVTSRFYRENRENYFYYPNGLQWMTDLNATKPPKFKC